MSDSNPPNPPAWINAALAVAALAALASILLALWLEGRTELHHSRGLIADLTVNLDGRQVREHCTTCHPGGARPHDHSAPDAATGLHPDIRPHSMETLGCTACHLGEGMAMDIVLSHGGSGGLGARRVLAGRQVQATCFTCHPPSLLPGAERAWQGYRLFISLACDSCHHIAGLDLGGRFGPDLSTVGSYLGLDRIVEAIREPRADPPNSIMPRYPLSKGESESIAYFLKSRVKNPKYATPMQIQAGNPALPSRSQAMGPGMEETDILTRSRCLACHRFGERDGRIAPDLTYIGAMRSEEFLRDFLKSPAALIPGAVMPPLPLTEDQAQELLRFLPEQKGHLHQSDPKNLYMHLCQRCHAAAGDGKGLIETNLANFPRPFAGNAEFFRSLSDERVLQSVRRGIAGTSMPPYGELLEGEMIESLLDLIFEAFIGTSRSEKASLPPLPARPAHLPDSRLTADLYARACAECHGSAGTGTGPRQLEFKPRPRNLTNKPYFADQEDERIARAIFDGVPGTGMAPFRERFESQELWGLVDKVRQFSGTGGRKRVP